MTCPLFLLLSKTPVVSRWLSEHWSLLVLVELATSSTWHGPSSLLHTVLVQLPGHPVLGSSCLAGHSSPLLDPKHGLCCLLFGTHSLGDVTQARVFQHSIQAKHSS